MKTSQPFAAAQKIFALLYTALAMTDFTQKCIAIANIPGYKSRGHGGKHMPHAHYGFAGSLRNRSSNNPHQGKKECARRVDRGY